MATQRARGVGADMALPLADAALQELEGEEEEEEEEEVGGNLGSALEELLEIVMEDDVDVPSLTVSLHEIA